MHTPPMWKLTVGYGSILILLGVGGYLGTGQESPTALIPSAFGLLILLCGIAAQMPARRKLAMHVAVGLALLGLLGTAKGVVGLGKMLSGVGVERPAAVISMAIMAILSAAYLAVAIRSFIAARKAQDASAPSA